MQKVEAPVKSSFASTINWAQMASLAVSVATIFGYKVPPELVGTVVGAIPTVAASATAVLSVFTIIKRTWFTTSITKASAEKM